MQHIRQHPSTMIYTIKRKYTNAHYTIYHETTERRCIIAFKDKRDAQSFMRNDFNGPKKSSGIPNSRIDYTNVSSLIRRCSINSIDLCIYGPDGEYDIHEAIKDPNENIVFNFENTIMFVAGPV
jgi:hypothetical protein